MLCCADKESLSKVESAMNDKQAKVAEIRRCHEERLLEESLAEATAGKRGVMCDYYPGPLF